MKIVIATFIIFFSCIVNAAEKHEAIPSAFQGKWVADLKYCNKGHEFNLSINSKSLQFYESNGQVISVVTEGKYELALIAELEGEGEKWIGIYHYQLSEDGNKITDISNPDEKQEFVRYKCVKK